MAPVNHHDDGERNWMVAGKGLLLEIMYNKPRAGSVYKRLGVSECLCKVCTRRHITGQPMSTIHGQWLWAYQNRKSAECSECHRPIAQHEKARELRQAERADRARASAARRRTRDLPEKWRAGDGRRIIARGWTLDE